MVIGVDGVGGGWLGMVIGVGGGGRGGWLGMVIGVDGAWGGGGVARNWC